MRNKKANEGYLEVLSEEESVRAGHNSVRLEVVHGECVTGVDEPTNELGLKVEKRGCQ